MSSTTIEQMITSAKEVMASLPELAAQNAYVYFNQATKRHGFYFATDDQAAERYARTSGRAEQTNWLIVAVVPSNDGATYAKTCYECRADFAAWNSQDALCPRCQREYLRENCL